MLVNKYISFRNNCKSSFILISAYRKNSFSTSSYFLTDKRKNDENPYSEGSSGKRYKEDDIVESIETDHLHRKDMDPSKSEELRRLQDRLASERSKFGEISEEVLRDEAQVSPATPDSVSTVESDPHYNDRTELYKFLGHRTSEGKEMDTELKELTEKSLNEGTNKVQDGLRDLIMVITSAKHSYNTAKVVLSEVTDWENEVKDSAVNLKEIDKDANSLYKEIGGVDAPYIPDRGIKPDKLNYEFKDSDTESNNESSSNQEGNEDSRELSSNKEDNNDNSELSVNKEEPKKGSLLDDFADPSTEPADYIGWDD